MIATRCHPGARETLEQIWRSPLPEDECKLRRIELCIQTEDRKILETEIYGLLSQHLDLQIYDPRTLVLEILRINEVAPSLVNYETPIEEIKDCFENTMCVNSLRADGLKVLDPSCGTGNWLKACLDLMPKANVLGIERNPLLAIQAQSRGLEVIQGDFLEMLIDDSDDSFDLILMSPPAQGREWLEHIGKALQLLNERGNLIAFVPKQGFYSKYAEDFRHFLAEHEAYWEPIYWEPQRDSEMLYIDFSPITPETLEFNWEGELSTYAKSIILILENESRFMERSPHERLAILNSYVSNLMIQSDARWLWDDRVKAQVKKYFKENR
jgi:SAM-dependent methyltransferase